MTTSTEIIKPQFAFVKVIICISSILILGLFSGFSTISEIQNWYSTIVKPSFNPPNFLFGPVWTLLYILMGVSFSIIILQKHSSNKTKAITIFLIQFILNLCWSFIFFKTHQIGWAFVEILCMWFSILVMIIVFYRLHRIAGLLQIPYLLWVSFASVLNGSIYFLN